MVSASDCLLLYLFSLRYKPQLELRPLLFQSPFSGPLRYFTSRGRDGLTVDCLGRGGDWGFGDLSMGSVSQPPSSSRRSFRRRIGWHNQTLQISNSPCPFPALVLVWLFWVFRKHIMHLVMKFVCHYKYAFFSMVLWFHFHDCMKSRKWISHCPVVRKYNIDATLIHWLGP